MPKGMTTAQLLELIRRDKKAVGKWPRFVLLEDVGKVHSKAGEWAVEVPQEVVESILPKLCL
jgi:3-dehydroquinate synthetase